MLKFLLDVVDRLSKCSEDNSDPGSIASTVAKSILGIGATFLTKESAKVVATRAMGGALVILLGGIFFFFDDFSKESVAQTFKKIAVALSSLPPEVLEPEVKENRQPDDSELNFESQNEDRTKLESEPFE
jgi:hypothetical protein